MFPGDAIAINVPCQYYIKGDVKILTKDCIPQFNYDSFVSYMYVHNVCCIMTADPRSTTAYI